MTNGGDKQREMREEKYRVCKDRQEESDKWRKYTKIYIRKEKGREYKGRAERRSNKWRKYTERDI